MKLAALFSTVLALTASSEPVTLTFDQAAALAARPLSSETAAVVASELSVLRWKRLPSVRAETTGNASRTLDLFAEGPLESRYAASVVAFDYPLWDGGASRARFNAVERRLRGIAASSRMDDARFSQLLNAFGDLYLAQRESDLIRPALEELSREADRSSVLLSRGEISNVTAAERRDAVLSLASRLLDLEARRIDAASRLRLLTRLEAEPDVTIEVDESIGEIPVTGFGDDRVRTASIAVEESRGRLAEVNAAAGLRAMLSGFAGIGAAQSQFRDVHSDGSFGIYGLRIHLSYPLIRGASGLALAEARADLAQALAARDAAMEGAQAAAAEHRLREATARKRIELLVRSVEAAREREESIDRLVRAGVRSENDMAFARAERVRREADLLAARVDRWKSARFLARMIAAAEPPQP